MKVHRPDRDAVDGGLGLGDAVVDREGVLLHFVRQRKARDQRADVRRTAMVVRVIVPVAGQQLALLLQPVNRHLHAPPAAQSES